MLGAVAISLCAVVAGFAQSIAGFGAGMIMMIVLPYLVGYLKATALTTAIASILSVILSVRYFKYADKKRVLLFSVSYVTASAITITLIKNLDLRLLTIIFGLFLVYTSAKNLVAKEKKKVSSSYGMAVACGLVGGVCSGMFAMGGPLGALYFMSHDSERNNYMGNTQCCGAFTAVIDTVVRAINGIFTVELVPLALVGMVFILVGQSAGRKWANNIQPAAVGKFIYIFIGLSGLVTIIRQLTL